MTKLSDTQAILLSTASQREDSSVLPLPAGIRAGGGATKALTALLKRELIEEREINEAGAVHRTDGDLRYGVFLTSAGANAIGIEPGEPAATGDNASATGAGAAAALPIPASATKKPTKAATVLALLTQAHGATLPELIAATGWLPHTTRAALTGLRKKGHDIVRSKRDGATCYRIAGQA